jgi:hypothetical protein
VCACSRSSRRSSASQAFGWYLADEEWARDLAVRTLRQSVGNLSPSRLAPRKAKGRAVSFWTVDGINVCLPILIGVGRDVTRKGI